MKLIDNLIKLTHFEQGIKSNKQESSGEDNFCKSSINFMRCHHQNNNNEDLCDNILIELFNQYEKQDDFKIEQPLGSIKFQNENYYLNKNYFIVGRRSKFFNKCDLNIEKSNFVSRIHFIIEFNSVLKNFFIYCVSKNGIFINNRFLQRGIPTQLDIKCTLRFPNTSIKIYFESSTESSINIDSKLNAIKNEPNLDTANKSIVVEIESKLAPITIDNNDYKNLKCINAIKAFIKTTEKLIDYNDENNLKMEKCENYSQQQDNTAIIKSNDSNSSVDNNDLISVNENEFDNENEDSQFSNSSLTNVNKTIKTKNLKKPAYSYAQLIAQAILSSNEKQLTLNQIYMFISRSYPYYKINDKGWQNSIRHNLSLNRYFVKIARQQNEPGKGSFWRIDDKCESKVIEQAYQRKRSRSITSINNEVNNNDILSKKIIDSSNNINEIDTPISPLSNATTTVPSPPSSHPLKVDNNDNDIYTTMRNTFISNENQQKLIKLLQSDTNNNILTTTDVSKQSQIPQAYLGYLYQVNPQTNETNNETDTNQIKNSSLQSLLNNTTLVLQCSLTQFANLMPNQNDSKIQNLRIIPFNTATNTDINNNNISPSSINNNNNNNSTKLRYLLNSDILTPINTANLLNSSDNHKNGNSNNSNNNKRVLESKDEIDENKLDNNENINKKQKIDDSTHILNSNTGGNNNDNDLNISKIAP